jgi:hypothetical protein
MGVLFFFPPHFAPDGRIGENNAPRTKTAHLQTAQADAQTLGLQKSCFFALAPVRFCYIWALT